MQCLKCGQHVPFAGRVCSNCQTDKLNMQLLYVLGWFIGMLIVCGMYLLTESMVYPLGALLSLFVLMFALVWTKMGR